ncbi:MAG: ThuA domain-containing protein [Cyclobacteriaceae bacterium]|nr:ThuA domain-containing protein [Cyclobacteriaceae bacterium]
MIFRRIALVIACGLITLWQACGQASTTSEDMILVFHKTAGFVHKSIPAGVQALKEIARDNAISVEATDDASIFNPQDLPRFKAVVFLSTTGNVLNDEQQAAFQQYIRSGGGFVGIHAAADTEYDWPWYNQWVGAYFKSHPKPQQAAVVVKNKNHPATRHLPDRWMRTDEWYNYKSIVDGLEILCELDESSYEGGENGPGHPIAWYREFDGGRTFYTGGGHTDKSFAEPDFRRHLLGGIVYAMGRAE